jgi:hypothetical protein
MLAFIWIQCYLLAKAVTGGRTMLIQLLIIFLQVSIVAAFLILWYFWVRKKMATSLLLDDNEQVLFPFRYFSWIFIGLIVVVSLVTTHFVRVSAAMHERLASFSAVAHKQEQQAKSVEEMKSALEKLRHEMDANFKTLRAQAADQYALMKYIESSGTARLALSRGDKDAVASVQAPVADPLKNRFAKEAKAFSAAKSLQQDSEKAGEGKVLSMRLARVGRVVTDKLRVRQRPQADAPVVEQLGAGQEVKVTEKRVMNENMWFKVITPTGKAGWVDFRYLKLEGSA